MKNCIVKSNQDEGIKDEELERILSKSVEDQNTGWKKVLLLPPDFTRSHSGAGKITAIYYELLKDTCQIEIMPALGTHMPMSDDERMMFFGDKIPKECFIHHNWRKDVVKIGEIDANFIYDVSEGLMNEPINVEVNKRLIDKSYDRIISIGQVVPHEVAGMANYNKNIFVGCGGQNMINGSHMLGAFFGMERIMGRDHTPVRKVFDLAEEKFAKEVPLLYVLTVTTQGEKETIINGLFIGRDRQIFEEAAALSREKNINFIQKPLNKVIVYLDEKEFKSTWLGNKAIYRTRMAIADGGELIILAPGVKHFGEDAENDRLIRKYGYVGRKRVLELLEKNADLKCNQSVTAHLIHGSADERFSVTYAVDKLTREEVEGVNFKYLELEEVYKSYKPDRLVEGFNLLENGEEVFYINNPALGLWADKNRFS